MEVEHVDQQLWPFERAHRARGEHGHHGIEDVTEPLMGAHLQRYGPAEPILRCGMVFGDVLQQPTGLVFPREDTRQPVQFAAMMAIGDLCRPEDERARFVRLGDDRFANAEPEVVEPRETPLEFGRVSGGVHRCPVEFTPDRCVHLTDPWRDLERVEVDRHLAGSGEIGQATRDVDDRALDVRRPLAVADLVVEFTRLGVERISGEAHVVAPEERIRERTVTPVEARRVQPGEQGRHRLDQHLGDVEAGALAEDVAERHRIVQETRDQGCIGLAALIDEGNRRDDRQPALVQRPQQLELAPGEPQRQFLQRIELAVVLDETDDVAVEADGEFDEPGMIPLGQRDGPGEVVEPGVGGGVEEPDPHPCTLHRDLGRPAAPPLRARVAWPTMTSPHADERRRSTRLAVVGRGRMGGALATALPDADGPFGRGFDGAGYDAVLLAVPDAAIESAAAAITPGPLVGHCAGAFGLDVLAPHTAYAMHPLMTVTHTTASFAGAAAAIAGSTAEALAFARELAERLGMRPFELADADRGAYHAAASIAANFLVTLEDAAETLLATTGGDRAALVPLVRAALDNWADVGGRDAITGPIVRGDDVTVERQRAAVADRTPELLVLFDALVERTRALVGRSS